MVEKFVIEHKGETVAVRIGETLDTAEDMGAAFVAAWKGAEQGLPPAEPRHVWSFESVEALARAYVIEVLNREDAEADARFEDR